MIPPDNPAGIYIADPNPSADRRNEVINEIEWFPMKLRQLVTGLNIDQLDTKYKNWTVRQIVHHLADSHINGYLRTKLALTEDRPTIKPYDETKWSQLPDAIEQDVDVSLHLLRAVHARWTTVLRALNPADFEREYTHPAFGKRIRLAESVGLYAWHGRHHSEMIAWLRRQHKWEN